MKSASLADFAIDRDLAIHQLDELAADRQPQAGSAVGAGDAFVLLAKRVKNQPQLFKYC